MDAAPFPFPALLPRATEEAWFPPLETGEVELLGQLEAQLEQRLLAIQTTPAPPPLGVVDGRAGDEEDEEEEEREEEDGEASAEDDEEVLDDDEEEEEEGEEGWETEQDEGSDGDVDLSD